MTNSFSTIIIASILASTVMTGCKPAAPKDSSVVSVPDIPVAIIEGQKKLNVCKAMVDIVLGGSSFDVIEHSSKSDRLILKISTPSDSEPKSITCRTEADKVTSVVVNGSRMAPSIAPGEPLGVNSYASILDLPNRLFGSAKPDGAVVKYFARFDFKAPQAGDYCVKLRHKAQDIARDSLKMSTGDGDLQTVSLPLTGEEIGEHVITAPKIIAKDSDALIPVRLTFRENMLTYGVTVVSCSSTEP